MEDLADAVVIDLGRLPSHGRDIGLYLRERKSTRHVPLLFAGGDSQKVERIRELLPDATYASWSDIDSALKDAISNAACCPGRPSLKLRGLLRHSPSQEAGHQGRVERTAD